MNIEDIMTENVIYCRPEDPVKHAARLLREYKISGIPVIKGDKVVGILTENDILKMLEVPERDNQLWLPSPFEVIEVPLRELISWEETRHALEDVGSKNVGDVMSHPVITARTDENLEEVASRMVKHKINRVPVVEDGKLVGIVTRQDIISGMALAAE
jgi:CBS domain-containing protein